MKNYRLKLPYFLIVGGCIVAGGPALADMRCGEGPERLKAIGATVEAKESSYAAQMPSAGRVTISCSVSGVLILAASDVPTPSGGFYSDLTAVAEIFHRGGATRHLLEACYHDASSAAAAAEHEKRQGPVAVRCSVTRGQGGFAQFAVTIDR